MLGLLIEPSVRIEPIRFDDDRAAPKGFAELAPRGLVFDAWLLHPQLDDLAALAAAFPETTIVLNHLGGPIGIGSYAGRRADAFGEWRAGIRTLAARPNVAVKLGGLGMALAGFGIAMIVIRMVSGGGATCGPPSATTRSRVSPCSSRNSRAA